jgi:ribonuclease Y
LNHSKEVAIVMGVMAGELGLNVALAKRIGLLHDIGKAVDFEMEGTHAQIGSDLAKKYGEKPVVVNAIGAHHGEIEPESVFAVLLMAADAISAARPGARRESIESYIKRLEKLEGIAQGFKGVEKAYAIQAGREIRIIISPDDVDDMNASKMAREIAQKIEGELDYPGMIKVNVIREKRYIEYAK